MRESYYHCCSCAYSNRGANVSDVEKPGINCSQWSISISFGKKLNFERKKKKPRIFRLTISELKNETEQKKTKKYFYAE